MKLQCLYVLGWKWFLICSSYPFIEKKRVYSCDISVLSVLPLNWNFDFFCFLCCPAVLILCKSNLKPDIDFFYPVVLKYLKNYHYYWFFTSYSNIGDCSQLGNSWPFPSVSSWVVSTKWLSFLLCASIYKVSSWSSTIFLGKFSSQDSFKSEY